MSDAVDCLPIRSAEAVQPSCVSRPTDDPLVLRISPNEQLISLTEAARRLPKIDGRKVAISTLWRWCRKGLGGENLEYVRVGRKVCTSHEALLRFFNRLAHLDERIPPDTHSRPAAMKRTAITSKQRQKALAEADEVLRRAGI